MDPIFVWHSQCPYIFILVRASTSVRVNFFSFYTSKTYLFYFTHLFLQNTYINLSIIHIYSNKIFIFLTLWTVTVRGERKEKRVRWREKREKKNKKIICTVNSNSVYIYGYCSFARPLCIFRHFYKNWWGGFGLKCVKFGTFYILEEYPWADVVGLSCLIRTRFSESREPGLWPQQKMYYLLIIILNTNYLCLIYLRVKNTYFKAWEIKPFVYFFFFLIN